MPESARPSARIAILCHGGGGGSTHAALHLASALARRGRTVLLVTLGRPRWAPPAGLRHIVIAADRPAPSRLDGTWSAPTIAAIAHDLAAICRREGVDLLHFHYGLPFAAVAAKVRAMLGTAAPAVVATLHGSDAVAVARDAALARALEGAAAISTVSAAYARLLRAAMPTMAPAVVANFLPDEPPMRASGRRSRDGPPTIVHISSFRAVKDTRAVARTFLAIRRRLPCRLLVAGDGPDRRGVRHLLRGRIGDVALPGFRSDVPALLRESDLMLLASRAESFGLAALEAMAAGVPVIAPRLGGLPEVVGDGIGGRLFHPGRIADAAAKAVALLLAPIHRRRMAVRARRRAAGFSEAEAIAGYEALYERALALHPAQP